ncbi:acyl-CoA dehydrogenase [Kribbella antibiotica]|uniref:Acyl-CoA dehydrogenase n=1 Tax=Kribbella antibiotica TaxID=190195 RepID=A0A4R4Z7H5_9ACTN|nr:acyl-CoA dehydrogenase family protein [Kribbella antibiotica]TDD54138.1 acyl-CoA dehydrogenase [Kribbella antibiotica]
MTDYRGIAGRAGQVDSTGTIPTENWQELVASGYFGVFHPEELGGTGGDVAAQLKAMESLARACSGTYWTATVSALLCGNLLRTYGNEKHHDLVRSIVSGERLAAFAIVETAAGSDASTYQTLVRRTGDGFSINGEKSRITNAPRADIAVTLARRERLEGDDGPEWCLAFVELDQPGVRRYDIPHMGLRGMPWGGIVYTDAHVDEANVIPVPFTELAEGMTWGWLLVSVAAIATAESALAATVRHAKQRVSFGRPLAHMEGVQAQLADSRAQLDAARVLALRAATERVAGHSARELIGMLKVYATEMAVEVTQRAVQIHGAAGVTIGHEVERHYRDAQMNVVGAFATNRLREQLVENLTQTPATYRPTNWPQPTPAPTWSGA